MSCSCDEVLRFKKSAAAFSASQESRPELPVSNNLLQVVVDNFDVDISSRNCKLSTRCFVMIGTKNGNPPETLNQPFPRLKKENMKCKLDDVHEANVVLWAKEAPMIVPDGINDIEFKNLQFSSYNRATKIDFNFFHDILFKLCCPEYNDCSKLNRAENNIGEKTTIAYMPLIDMPPADPTTIKTAMIQAKKISSSNGQEFLVFTCDQQLYRVSLQVLWDDPILCKTIFVRLGGMHFLMSNVGCVGVLAVLVCWLCW